MARYLLIIAAMLLIVACESEHELRLRELSAVADKLSSLDSAEFQTEITNLKSEMWRYEAKAERLDSLFEHTPNDRARVELREEAERLRLEASYSRYLLDLAETRWAIRQ
jgi:hypothetical protein